MRILEMVGIAVFYDVYLIQNAEIGWFRVSLCLVLSDTLSHPVNLLASLYGHTKGFYNDHHFHYGHFIYAAAVVAQYDAGWGRKYFERVVLLIRDIANPSKHDSLFPRFRQKDWYQGSSWASGINFPPLMNGRNQESTSESIAAYEAVALYGKVMVG
jgi:endoglucanase Acf2